MNATKGMFDRPGNWHAQASQDEKVVKVLGGMRRGYFVDLAANEPILLSNTRALERDYDWSGLCIDGNQAMLEKLVVQRTCRVVKGVVSSESGKEVCLCAALPPRCWSCGPIRGPELASSILGPAS